VARSARVKPYDRARVLARARRAARRGSHGKAITLFERVLADEPDNVDLRRRVATARLRAGRRGEALRDCHLAARGLAERGFVAQAIGLYREFCRQLAREASIWESLSELELERKRAPDAVAVLVEGSRHFRSRRRRPQAVALLRRARSIDPTHFEAGFQLADVTWRSGHTRPARRLLQSLEPHARTRRDRRRLRARLFRLAPTPAAAWRWLDAVLDNRAAPPPASLGRSRG